METVRRINWRNESLREKVHRYVNHFKYEITDASSSHFSLFLSYAKHDIKTSVRITAMSRIGGVISETMMKRVIRAEKMAWNESSFWREIKSRNYLFTYLFIFFFEYIVNRHRCGSDDFRIRLTRRKGEEAIREARMFALYATWY